MQFYEYRIFCGQSFSQIWSFYYVSELEITKGSRDSAERIRFQKTSAIRIECNFLYVEEQNRSYVALLAVGRGKDSGEIFLASELGGKSNSSI